MRRWKLQCLLKLVGKVDYRLGLAQNVVGFSWWTDYLNYLFYLSGHLFHPFPLHLLVSVFIVLELLERLHSSVVIQMALQLQKETLLHVLVEHVGFAEVLGKLVEVVAFLDADATRFVR